jgi:hypothetical protein
MKKHTYLKICLEQPIEWLAACIEDPSPYMRPIHVLIARLAIRIKTRRGIHP